MFAPRIKKVKKIFYPLLLLIRKMLNDSVNFTNIYITFYKININLSDFKYHEKSIMQIVTTPLGTIQDRMASQGMFVALWSVQAS